VGADSSSGALPLDLEIDHANQKVWLQRVM